MLASPRQAASGVGWGSPSSSRHSLPLPVPDLPNHLILLVVCSVWSTCVSVMARCIHTITLLTRIPFSYFAELWASFSLVAVCLPTETHNHPTDKRPNNARTISLSIFESASDDVDFALRFYEMDKQQQHTFSSGVGTGVVFAFPRFCDRCQCNARDVPV